MAKYQNPTDTVLEPGKNFTAKATAAVSGSRFVSFTAGGTRQVPNAAHATDTTAIVGVSKYDAASGETFGVVTGGHVGVTAGAVAIVVGDRLVADATGKAVKVALDKPYVGVAYTDAAPGAVVYIQF